MKTKNKIEIYDTTLRDGTQQSGMDAVSTFSGVLVC